MVWLAFGANHLRNLIEHLGHYPWAWFNEVVQREYGGWRVPSFLVVTILIGAGLDNNGWSVGLAEGSTESALVL